MKQRINFKTIYLIATITVGLLGLAIGSTYCYIYNFRRNK